MSKTFKELQVGDKLEVSQFAFPSTSVREFTVTGVEPTENDGFLKITCECKGSQSWFITKDDLTEWREDQSEWDHTRITIL